jgi:hypothetical protein
LLEAEIKSTLTLKGARELFARSKLREGAFSWGIYGGDSRLEPLEGLAVLFAHRQALGN